MLSSWACYAFNAHVVLLIANIRADLLQDSPQLNVHTKPEPRTPTQPINADGYNTQAVYARFDEDEFINPFGIRLSDVAESSSRNIEPSNMHMFYQQYLFKFQWTKDDPLEQFQRDPTKPI
ncbi:hypothetical protein Tco_1374483 [Tanacetum coccineum]